MCFLYYIIIVSVHVAENPSFFLLECHKNQLKYRNYSAFLQNLKKIQIPLETFQYIVYHNNA